MPKGDRRRRLTIALALWLGTAPAPALASELVLGPEGGHVVEGRVNHHPVRLRVDPETPGHVILNGDAAFRLRLFPTTRAAAVIIGPVRVEGASRPTPVTLGGITGIRRVVWTDRTVVDGADGVISPADLPYDRVTLRFRVSAADEQEFEFPMRFGRDLGLFHSLRLRSGMVHVRVSTSRSASLATAAAGALLVQEFGGGWDGEARRMTIKYGVDRPVRPIRLDRPALLAGQPITDLLVRTRDHRGILSLPADAPADPDEVVVTAQIQRQPARFLVSLGLDWLSSCSSLTWDNNERRMTLRCARAALTA